MTNAPTGIAASVFPPKGIRSINKLDINGPVVSQWRNFDADATNGNRIRAVIKDFLWFRLVAFHFFINVTNASRIGMTIYEGDQPYTIVNDLANAFSYLVHNQDFGYADNATGLGAIQLWVHGNSVPMGTFLNTPLGSGGGDRSAPFMQNTDGFLTTHVGCPRDTIMQGTHTIMLPMAIQTGTTGVVNAMKFRCLLQGQLQDQS